MLEIVYSFSLPYKSIQIREAAKKKFRETSSKGTCFHCGKEGHWKRNCKAYMESKKKVACDAPTPSGIYVIEINTISHGNL